MGSTVEDHHGPPRGLRCYMLCELISFINSFVAFYYLIMFFGITTTPFFASPLKYYFYQLCLCSAGTILFSFLFLIYFGEDRGA